MKLGSIAAFVASVVIGLPIGLILFLGGSALCGGGGDAPAPSAAAENGIPANYLALYQQAGAEYGIPWTLLAGIGSIETNHGRLDAPGVTSGTNDAAFPSGQGCCAGPMQFLITGPNGGTWGAYGVDGDGDGDKDVYDPRDAIPGAARYLKASGAPGDLHRAIFAYNHSEAYVQSVLAKMREYAATAPASSPAGATATTTTTRGAATTTSTAPPAAAAATGPVLNLGDSLAVGSGPPLAEKLSGRTVTTLAAENRTSNQGLAVLRGLTSVPSTLIVQLGTNDTDISTFRANVLSVLAIARRDAARVFWVNISRPPLSGTRDSALNAVLAQAAASHDNLVIVDWHAVIARGDVELGDDVHPSPAGYAARAELIAGVLGSPSTPSTSGPTGGCSDLGGVSTGGGSGQFTLAPTANRPGVDLTPALTAYIERMATFYEGRLVVSYGTNHDRLVANSDRESDHWRGNAADFGMADNGGTNDGPVGDAIAAAAFMAAGLPRDVAIARGRAGGGITVVSNGLRIQIIWKVDGDFGDHHDHVHVGIGRA